jgi:tetratricopeptide (TPR) repeat protein
MPEGPSIQASKQHTDQKSMPIEECELGKAMHSTMEDKATAYLFRAGVYMEQKYYQKALEDLDSALAYNPNDSKLRVTVHNNKGFILFDKKEFESSVQEFGRALDWRPTYHLALKGRGLAYLAMGKTDLALTDLDQAIEISPDDSKYAARAFAKLKKGSHMEALSDSNEALRINSNNHSAYCYKGLSFCHQGNFGHALHNLTKGIELCPTTTFYYGFRSIVWYLLGNKKTAKEDFSHADLVTGAPNEILSYFKEIILRSPDDMHSYLMRGVLYAIMGDMENMKRDITKIISSTELTLHSVCNDILVSY